MPKSSILAHVCCAPDALYVVALLQEDHAVTGLFDNPNIWPESEYALRLAEARKVERLLGFRLLEGPYEPAAWFAATRAYSDAPERGPRCRICYALRLERTARLARRMGISAFTTIMSVSPWKRADILNQIGRRLGRKHGLTFLEADFKKKNGFQRSVELSRAHGLYRQNYCGCRSSLRPRPLSVSP